MPSTAGQLGRILNWALYLLLVRNCNHGLGKLAGRGANIETYYGRILAVVCCCTGA